MVCPVARACGGGGAPTSIHPRHDTAKVATIFSPLLPLLLRVIRVLWLGDASVAILERLRG